MGTYCYGQIQLRVLSVYGPHSEDQEYILPHPPTHLPLKKIKNITPKNRKCSN
jgi:hypothetical protein